MGISKLYPVHRETELTARVGYPMAKNLRAKITERDDLIICDVKAEATKKFVEEVRAEGKSGAVHIAQSPRDAAQKSVSSP